MRPRVQAMSNAGVKKLAEKTLRGVKAVGRGFKKAIKWPAKQIEKEWRGEDEHIENFRRKQKERGLIN